MHRRRKKRKFALWACVCVLILLLASLYIWKLKEQEAVRKRIEFINYNSLADMAGKADAMLCGRAVFADGPVSIPVGGGV